MRFSLRRALCRVRRLLCAEVYSAKAKSKMKPDSDHYNPTPAGFSAYRLTAVAFLVAGIAAAVVVVRGFALQADPELSVAVFLEAAFAVATGLGLLAPAVLPSRLLPSMDNRAWLLGTAGVGLLFIYAVFDTLDNFLVTPNAGTLMMIEETTKLLGVAALVWAIALWVSELRRREQELATSRQRFQDVADAAGEYIWEIDPQGVYTMVTAPAEELLGRAREDILGHSPFEFMPDEETRRLQDWFAGRARDQKPWQGLEHRSVRPDGSIVWQRVTGLPFYSSDGSMAGFRGTGMDITGEKEAEKTERGMVERLRLAAEAAELGIWELRTSDNYLEWDEGMLRVYGVDREAFSHSIDDWYQAVLPEYREQAARDFESGVAGGEAYRSEFSIRRADGAIRHIRAMAKPIHDADGNPVRVVGINEDVTQEVESRRQLEETTRELEGFFDVTLGLLVIATTDGRFIKLNRAWEQILGYELSELSNQGFLDYVHPDDISGTESAMARLGAGEEVTDFVNRYRRRDGGYRWVRWQARARDGLIYASANDITESVELQEKLSREKEFLQLVIDSTPNPVFAKDWLGRHTLVNEAVARLFGRSKDKILGTTDYGLTATPEEIRAFLRDDREVIESGVAKHIPEEQLTDSEGRTRWFQTTKVPLVISDSPEERQVLGVANEITELKAQKEKMELILEAARNVSFVATTPTPEKDDATIVEFSPGAEHVFGYEKDEVVGKSASILHSSESLARFPEIHDRIAAGEAWHGREWLIRKGGEAFPVLFTVYPFPIYGSAATLGVSIDITELEQTQEELRIAKEKAEAADRSKSDFLANMSHEIRTPMNAVVGLSDLLLQTELSGQQSDYLNKISASSRMLLGIINDILDYSKIEADKLELDSHTFRVDELLDQMKTLFAPGAGERELELLFRVSPDVPRNLVGDSLRLGQVFSNLLSNAIKFTDEGSIELRITRLGGTDEHPRLRFHVQDTGIGMDEQQRARLFTAFTQGDTSTTRKYGGTGLGLVISRQLVEKMGGTLEVESAPGRGSSFSFELIFPVADPATPELAIERGCHDLDGSRVMIVDDHEASRVVVREILERCDVWVEEADNGITAVERVLAADEGGDPFHFILVDWKMPGELDGLATIARLRRLVEEGVLTETHAPLFLVSAYNRDDIPEDSPHFEVFLGKPVTASALFDAMADATGGSSREPALRNSAGIPSFAGVSILLVEDNEVNREIVERMLEKTAATVITAENGAEAVELVKSHECDLILMDLQMPVMDGFEATETIRRTYPHVPVIALTAAVMDTDRRKAAAAGMNDHVAKPVDSNTLYRVLAEWLEEREAPQPATAEHHSERNRGLAAAEEAVPDVPEALEGFDLERGLRIADGDTAFYLRMLHRFHEQLLHRFVELGSRIAQEDPEAPAALHSLKGLAATVGAVRIENVVASLDRAYKEHAPITREMREELEEATREAERALRNIPRSSPSSKRAPELDFEQGTAAMADLADLLRKSELVEEALLATVSGFVHDRVGPRESEKLERLVHGFENDDALALLQDLSSTVGVERI